MQNTIKTNHIFVDDHCINCGWSIRWTKLNGWNCLSSNYRETIKEDGDDSEHPNFLNHVFVDGYCNMCGWEYSWAKKKNQRCPVSSSCYEFPKNDQEEDRHKGDVSNDKVFDEGKIYGKILGLSGKITVIDIKKSYRNLSKKYHPDRVSELGEEFRQLAEIRMKEINRAYKWFKDKYDFKYVLFRH